MGDLLSYKTKVYNCAVEYYGTVEYSGKDQCLRGRVVGIKKSIPYKAASLEELQFRFKEAVDQYFQECCKEQKMPEIPYKGVFSVRFPSELHRDIAMYAIEQGSNLNSVMIEAVEEFLKEHNKKNEDESK